MARAPEGPPPAPAVQRLRLRYAKRGRLRFSSHRDFQRAFERALRRAGVPMAYSAGFTPHPKVSYAGAAPTGVASEAEYLEIAVAQRVDPRRLASALDASLPPGLDILEVVETGSGSGSLAERLAASVWELRLPGVDPGTATHAVSTFLRAERVEVSRLTKNGVRTFDSRAAVVALDTRSAAPGAAGGSCAILRLVVRHITPAVRPDDVLAGLRPDDVLAGLRQVAALAPPVPPEVTRLAQGPLEESAGSLERLVGDPLSPDRDAVGTVAPAPPA
jgi:radical SAM-linked protein